MSDPLMDHEYDGIQEYDNPLPFWWKGLFAITVAFAAAYAYWYHLGGPGPTIHEEWAAEVRELEAVRAAYAAKHPAQVDEATLVALSEDSGVIERGQSVFGKYCVSCHADQGQGLVGPNLTDAYQIHGTSVLDIHHTITEGVPARGMLAWGPMLAPDDLTAVAVFVGGLRGRDVPNGKPPEGSRIEQVH